MSRPRDVEIAVSAASAGASVLRARYGGPLTRFAKSAADFATEADLEAERAIREVIAAVCPDDAFEGEEGGLTGAVDADRTWLVDPLCGTLNFAAGTPLACVNVALRQDGQIAAAAVADPFTDELFWTDGTGSYLSADDASLRPDASSRLVDVDFDRRPAWSAALVSSSPFTARFGTRVSSTSLALAWVASGRRAGYVVAGETYDSVHFAAGTALCRAAGCAVTDLLGESIGAGSDGLVAAADPETLAALLEMIAVATRTVDGLRASRPDR